MKKKLIGIDIGASSGKMAYGEYDGKQFEIIEYRDFENRPVDIGTALYWDIFSLYHAIIDGMVYFKEKYGEADLMGIDTWGASYGLLDNIGRLLEPVYHYRDLRTAHVIEDMKKVMSDYELFQLSGCQCNRTYTLPQLYTYHVAGSRVLEQARHMLLLPDLLGYFLTGNITSEMTIAGTSCLMESSQVEWSSEIADKFSIPHIIYTEIVDPGTSKGFLTRQIQSETGMKHTKLVATVGHDSAAAVAAIPEFGENQLYVSIGTNISMGVERKECLLTRKAFTCGFKNTGGINRNKIVYRDFSACWHMNEFMRTRREQGVIFTHEKMMKVAAQVKTDVPWIDVEESTFNDAGGNYIDKMNAYFSKTGQRELRDDGELIRSIYESIVLKVRHYAMLLKKLGIEYKQIKLMNGAIRNELLVQMMANALEAEVTTSMVYASLAGNMLTQLYADGEVESVEDMRRLSGQSHLFKTYNPGNFVYWREASEQYEKLKMIK